MDQQGWFEGLLQERLGFGTCRPVVKLAMVIARPALTAMPRRAAGGQGFSGSGKGGGRSRQWQWNTHKEAKAVKHTE